MLRKNQKHVFLIIVTVVALAVTALWVSQAVAKPKVAPPNSNAFGKTMAEWLTVYWRSLFEGGEGKVGNVLLLPMPAGVCEGEGTEQNPNVCVGELDITIEAGTAFVLPLFAWIGERYDGYPGVPDDEPIPDDLLIAWTHPNLTLDGEIIVSDENKESFYVGQTLFDPPIVWAPPSPAGLVWFQGFGIVCPPLSEGEHVLHLYEPFSLFDSYFGVYDNTWNITVVDEDDNDD
jgi:hypothetical protein